MKRIYHGSCHCGAVRFECEADLAAGTSRCNCSICGKGRFWKAIVKAPDFRLLQGEEALSDYRFDGAAGAPSITCSAATAASSYSDGAIWRPWAAHSTASTSPAWTM